MNDATIFKCSDNLQIKKCIHIKDHIRKMEGNKIRMNQYVWSLHLMYIDQQFDKYIYAFGFESSDIYGHLTKH